jgi:gamma-glutamyltranspeptidase/glutathione hydrolase
VFDAGMGLQEAIEAPRWTSFPGTDPANLGGPFELWMDAGFPPTTLSELERRGHRLVLDRVLPTCGGVQAILVDTARGTYVAGSDPRVDGSAIGL